MENPRPLAVEDRSEGMLDTLALPCIRSMCSCSVHLSSGSYESESVWKKAEHPEHREKEMKWEGKKRNVKVAAFYYPFLL
jgi:hypothetical protein